MPLVTLVLLGFLVAVSTASAQSLTPALDRNPDPRIIEVDLTARVAEVEIAPGKLLKAWTYDGGLPGPLIRASVGDRVIVHFTNHLPLATTVPCQRRK